MNKDKLDRKDLRLLYELRRNCRQGYAQLAKILGISKQMVQYRIHRLAKRGILANPTIAIDASKLGYLNYAVYFQWQDVSVKQTFIEEILKDKTVRYAADATGRYEFVVSFFAKSPSEFRNIWDTYLQKFGKSIRSQITSISVENWSFSKMRPSDDVSPQDKKAVFLGGSGEAVALDEGDMAILKYLSMHGRESLLSLAKKCKLAPDTIRRKMRTMEKEGVIQGYFWLFHPNTIKIYLYELLLSLRGTDPEKWRALRAYCEANPSIGYFIRTIGKFDADVVFEVKEDEVDQQLLKFRSAFSDIIQDFEIIKITKEYLFTYLPPFE